MTDAYRDVHTQAPSLEGRRVLVTGGTTGIGRATAALLASYGAKVFIFGRHQPELDDALAHICEVGGEGHGMTADVSRQEDVDRVFAAVEETLGGLDVLVNNAGVYGSALDEMEEKDWRYSVETNLLGYMACAKAAVPRLENRGDGQIVLVGSVSAVNRGPGSSVYVATKSGIQGFAASFRKEMAEKQIRVTLIEPGLVGADLQGTPPEEQRPKIAREEMLRAEDIAVGIHYALTQPSRCDVVALQIEPRLQKAG